MEDRINLMIRKERYEEKISDLFKIYPEKILDLEKQLNAQVELYQEQAAYLSQNYYRTKETENQLDTDASSNSLAERSRASHFMAYALRMIGEAKEVSFTKQERICKYVKCSIGFLNDRNLIQFSPMPEEAEAEKIAVDKEIIFDIMDIMDMISFSEKYRTIQIQLSRVALYHISQKNNILKVALSKIPQEKTNYLLNGVLPATENEDEKYILASGYTLQELREIGYLTGMSFPEMFTGKSRN